MKSKRQCGSCTLCCKVMGVPEVKERHDWCPHAARDGSRVGCGIYRKRPERCREFHCMWLIDEKIGEHWYPKKSKIVIDVKLDPRIVCFVVDPAYPLRWLEEPWFSDIKNIAKAGIDGRHGKTWGTVVMIKDTVIPVGEENASIEFRSVPLLA